MHKERTALFSGPFFMHTSVLALTNMTNSAPGATRVNTSTLWATLGAFVAVLAAGVALSFTGMEAGAIVAFLTGLVAVAGGLVALLDRVTHVQRVNAEQDAKLDVVEKRTNGALQADIRATIAEALDERFGPRPGGEA